MLLAFSNLFTRHWCGPITASCFRGLYNKFVADFSPDSSESQSEYLPE